MSNEIVIRPGTLDDWPAAVRLFEFAFGHRSSEEVLSAWSGEIGDSMVVATDNGSIVGQTMDLPMTTTVPGGAQLAGRGISLVAVAPTHRRRGLLRAMFTEQHKRIAASGVPLALLTASEAGIYGRFGYGAATVESRIRIDRRLAKLHADVPDPGGVRVVSVADATELVPAIYERWQALTPGAQVRPKAMLDRYLANADKPGATPPYAIVHPDGYALFSRRTKDNEGIARVFEFRAITTDAHAALWRILLTLDLVTYVEAVQSPEDPLQYLLTDSRLVEVDERADALWVRIMDVPAALEARTYSGDLDVVVEVRDEFLDAGGTFALTVTDGKARCVRTDAPAQVSMNLDVLGSLYLGAHRARVLAAGHRLWAKDSETLRAFDLAFQTDRAAEMGWGF